MSAYAAQGQQGSIIELKPVTSPAMATALDEFRTQTAALASTGASKVTANRPAPKAVWHGRVYENLRNDVFDANPHQIRQRGGDKRKLRRNQYGGSVTGPVVLPKLYNGSGKTFFTFTYEGVRESIGQFSLNTIPTTLERAGQWAHVVDSNGQPLPLYDPLTTVANPQYDPSQVISTSNLQYLRQVFPGNVIPVTRLDRVGQTVLRQLPQPNTNAGPFFQNNYFAVTPEVNTANGFIVSVDHSFRKKHRVTVRLNKSDGLNGNAPNFPTLANSNNPSINNLSRGMRVDHVYTASPTSVNTLRVSADSQPNRNIAQLDANGKPFPRFQFFTGGGNGSNYTNIGQNSPVSRDAFSTFVLNNTYSQRWKAHRFSVETDVQHRRVNSFRPQSPEGRFDFNAGYTGLPGIVNTGHAFASFLLGVASQAQHSIVISPNYYRWNFFRDTLSDTWQVRKSLTLTISASLTSFGQRTEKYDRQTTISFTEINPENQRPGALVAAGRGGYGRSFQPRWTKVEPGITLAWSVLGDNNTVVRLSYNRYYGQPQIFNGHFGTQGFNGQQFYLSSNVQLQPALILAEGLRPKQFPDLRPDVANGTTPQVVDTSGAQPTSQAFQVRLQRQLAKNLIFSMTYSRTYGKNQFANSNLVNPNAIPLENLKYRDQLNTLSFANSLRPFPQFLDFDVAQSFALGSYLNRNFVAQIEKRTQGGLALTVAYTNYRRWDNYSSAVQNVYDRNGEKALSGFSQPHQVDVTFLYELPFGPGKPLLASGFLGRHIVGGWAFSGTSSISSGQPLRLQPMFNNTGGVIQQNHLYVNEVPGVDPHVKNQSPRLWFNPSAFVNPENFTLGTGPRIHPSLLSPGAYNQDMTLNKRMAAGADRTLEFTATLLNATNHANWNNPDTRIGTVATPNFNAGRIIGSTGGRIVQLGLRLNF